MALLDDEVGDPQVFRLPGVCRASAQHHFHRRYRVDQSGQADGAAQTRMQPQLHLGQTERGPLDGDAVVASQHQFKPRAEGCAVNDRDGRTGEPFQPVEERMPFSENLLGRLRIHLGQRVDVGPGGKPLGFAGADDQRARRIRLDLIQMR